MRTKRNSLIAALIALACVSDSGRCHGAGTFAFASLGRSTTAQETSWGGLEGTGVQGPEALRANPAGLAAATGAFFALSHQSWLTDLQEQWSGWTGPLGPGAVAVEVAATHAGSLDAYDENGNPLGSFSPIEGTAGIGYGLRVSGSLRVGGSLHGLYLSAPGSHLTGFASSWGIEAAIPGGTLGFALRNLGPDVRGDQGTYRLPAEAVLGVAQSIRRFGLLSLTGTIDRDQVVGVSGGVRWAASSAFALLAGAGYRPGDTEGTLRPGAGAEITVGSLGIAYAFAPELEGPVTHHISLKFIGRPRDRGSLASMVPSQPLSWTVWGGTHRAREGAMAEVHALEMQHVQGAQIVSEPDGNFRVRIASHLAEGDARDLAHTLNASAALE